MHNLLIEMLDNRFDAANQSVVFLIVASLILTTLSVTVVLCCCKQKKKKKVTSTISPAPGKFSLYIFLIFGSTVFRYCR